MSLITNPLFFKLFVKKQLNIVVIEKYIYRFAAYFKKMKNIFDFFTRFYFYFYFSDKSEI